MKVNTIEQFYCLEWIKENFYVGSLTLRLIDSCSIEIEDMHENKARVSYINKNNIVLKEED